VVQLTHAGERLTTFSRRLSLLTNKHSCHAMFTSDLLFAKEVATRNLVNKTANEIQAEIQQLLLPLVGTKIVKVTPYRSAAKKLNELLLPLERKLQENKFRLVIDWSYERIVYATLDKTYQSGEYSCSYVKREFYVCSIVDGVLLSGEWRESEPGRTDYTVEEITKTREEIGCLEAKVSALKSQIREFTR